MRRCRENGRVPHSVRTALSGDGRPSSDEEASIVASVAAQDVEYTRPCQPFSGQRESAWTYVENATIYHAQYDLRCCPEKITDSYIYSCFYFGDTKRITCFACKDQQHTRRQRQCVPFNPVDTFLRGIEKYDDWTRQKLNRYRYPRQHVNSTGTQSNTFL